MKFNKYIDLDKLKMCAKEGIFDSCGMQVIAEFGISPDRYGEFANTWADIVIHSLPTEYVEQLTDATAIGRTIGDYTNKYRQLTRSDFIDFIDYVLDITAMPPKQNPGEIINCVIDDIKKCCFEPDIDTYRKYRKFVLSSYHKMIIDASVPGYRLMSNDPNMLTNNMHIFTAFTKWIIGKLGEKIEKDQLMVDFTKMPDAMYNVLKEYVSRYGWDRFIEEADRVHIYLSPTRGMTRTIDRYFEDQIDSLIRLELNKILLVASNKVSEDFRVNGVPVGVSEATWNNILRASGISLYSGVFNIAVTDVTSKTNSLGETEITTKCRLTDGLAAEISYDSQGNVLRTQIMQEPSYSSYGSISYGSIGAISGNPIYKTDDYHYTWDNDSLSPLLNNQIDAEIAAKRAELNNAKLSIASHQDYADAISTGRY